MSRFQANATSEKPDELAEAVRDDERRAGRGRTAAYQPTRRQREPARVAGAAAAGAGLRAPALGRLGSATPRIYDALNSVQIRSRSRVPLAVTLFGSSFASVLAGGKTTGLVRMLRAELPFSSARLSGEP